MRPVVSIKAWMSFVKMTFVEMEKNGVIKTVRVFYKMSSYIYTHDTERTFHFGMFTFKSL